METPSVANPKMNLSVKKIEPVQYKVMLALTCAIPGTSYENIY